MNGFATSFPRVTYSDTPRLGFVDSEGNRIYRNLLAREEIGLEFVGGISDYISLYGLDAELVVNGEIVATLPAEHIRTQATVSVPNVEGEVFWQVGDVRSPVLNLSFFFFEQLYLNGDPITFDGTPLVFNATENLVTFGEDNIVFDDALLVFNTA